MRDVTVDVASEAVAQRPCAEPSRRSTARASSSRTIRRSWRTSAARSASSSKIPVKNRQDLSTVYTPGVARVSMAIAADPSKAFQLTIKRNTVAVVTDGTAVLGLGDIGPLGALPVMEGKAMLFRQFADIDAFPICLDTKDVDEIVETVVRIAPVFGGINLEDISAPRCFEVEERLIEALDIPGHARRPARHRRRHPRGADQRGARRRQANWRISRSSSPAAARPEPRRSRCCSARACAT